MVDQIKQMLVLSLVFPTVGWALPALMSENELALQTGVANQVFINPVMAQTQPSVDVLKPKQGKTVQQAQNSETNVLDSSKDLSGFESQNSIVNRLHNQQEIKTDAKVIGEKMMENTFSLLPGMSMNMQGVTVVGEATIRFNTK